MGGIPFGNPLTSKVCENFDGLCITQNNQAAIAFAVAYLLDRAWIITGLTWAKSVSFVLEVTTN